MKLGFVCYPTFGGSGVMATELGMALASKGFEVHFITSHLPVRLDFLSSGLHFHQVTMEEYPLFRHQPYQLALSSKLVEVVLKHDLDLLHVHYAIPHAYAAYMAKQMLKSKGKDIKVVTTLHGTDITLVGSNPNYQPAVEFSINNSDIVTAVSHSLKRDTERFFELEKEVEVVYNFIDIEKYEKDSEDCYRRDALASEDQFIITHVSNFRAVKRVTDVIEIFALIREKYDAKLLLLGDGPEMDPVKILATELGVKKDVIFLGNSNEVSKVLCLSDLFILPSETESFGLAALEAMAAKTPVISTNTGGLPEVNIDAVTGYLSDIGDVDDMADNAKRILSSSESLQEFKLRAFEQAKTFSIEKIVPQYIELYKKALN